MNTKKKILLGYQIKREILIPLEQDFEFICPENDFFHKHELIALLEGFDVFVPGWIFKTDKTIIDSGKNLKLIAICGAGYNHVDVDYAISKGITVTHTPNSVTEPTAELCFGLMLATARKIAFFDRQMRKPELFDYGFLDHLGTSLYGKRLGIFGMGRIGRALAKRALASGMNIIYHDIQPLSKETEEKYQARYVDFDELLSESDVISLHVPATDKTYHIIGEKEFGKMKSSAILINTARGSLIDESALLKALTEKKIQSAGLDVFEREPYFDDEFKNLDNVVLTAHIGARTLNTSLNMDREVVSNILGFFNGGSISKVN